MKIDILCPDCTERLGNRLWVLTQPFIFSVDDKVYNVPRGFVIDGASSPRLFWWLCPPMAGPFGQADIAHAWFYSPEGPNIGRLKADIVFYHIGRMRGASFLEAKAIKLGVNALGWWSYKKGRDKVTEKSTYNFVQARLRIAQLRLMDWSPLV